MVRTRCLSLVCTILSTLIWADSSSGALLSGVVTDLVGTGVGSVDLDVHDGVTGMKIPTANDSTDPDGTFDIIVPAGFYDLVFNAPVVSRLVSVRIRGFTISEPGLDVGQIALTPGALLSGILQRGDNAAAVVDADLDVDLSFEGGRVVTPSDDTDSTGAFAIVVPFGTVDITFEPRLSDGLVPARRLAVPIGGDLSLGVVVLQPGVVVSGLVRSQGSPVAGAEIDIFLGDGAQVPTPGGRADGNGQYSVVLPLGNHTIRTGPPLGSGFAHSVLPISVGGALTFNVDLTASSATVAVGTAGRFVSAGQSYRPEVLFLNNTGAPLAIRALVQVSLPSMGRTRNVAPPLDRTVPSTPSPLSGRARVPIPVSLPAPLRGVPLWFQVSVLDPGSGLPIDADFREFRVQ